MKTMKQQKHEQGFTLIELSIVLVIIGLIVGGVLVGQDMIRSAEIRSTIGQYEDFNVAKNTFRGKYGANPGDGSSLANFGFLSGAGAANGVSDGDGLIEACSAGAAAEIMGCERLLFWNNLAAANMINATIAAPGNTDWYDDNSAANTGGITVSDVVPPSNISPGAVWHVGEASGLNFFYLTSASTATAAAGVMDDAEILAPIDSFNIDNKVDDGQPNTGIVRAMEDLSTLSTAAGSVDASGDCVTATATTGSYNTDEDNAGESEAPSCNLRMRMN